MPFDNNPFVGQGALNFLNDNDFQNQLNQQMNIGNNQNRSNALDAGLINFGAGMIGGPTLKEGLARGLMGFNQGYNASLNANKPKVTPLADGAFSQVTLPDGTSKIIGNQSVADFLMKREAARQLSKESLALLQGGIKVDSDANIQRRKNLVTQAGGEDAPLEFSSQVSSDLDKINKLSTWYESGKADKLAGLDSPVGSDLYNRTIGALIGTDEYKLLRDFDQYTGENLLSKAAQMKGALSDKDVEFLKGMNVKSTDPTARKIEYLREYAKRVKEGEERRMKAASELRQLDSGATRTNTTSTRTNPTTPKSTIPGLSEGASKYFSD